MEAEILSLYKSIQVVPSATKVAGEVELHNDTLGFYLTDFTQAMLDDNQSATLVTHSELTKVIKNAGEVWTAGEFIYWDDGNSEFTNVEGAATVLGGIVAQAAASAAVEGVISFNGELASIRGKEIVTGSSAVTGSLADIATGLTLIQSAIASVMITTQGAGEAAYVTVDHGADGNLDLYAWDDGGVAATVAATVYWIVIGLK